MVKNQNTLKSSRSKLMWITKVAVLSAVSVIVMLFEIPLPFAPPFYKLDLSDTVVLIGSFALGPIAGMVIEFIKNLLKMLLSGSLTAGVGELANFITGCSFILPAAWIYRGQKTRKHAMIGMGIGTVTLTLVGSLLNLFLLLPVYAAAFHMPLSAIVQMGAKVNAAITSLPTLVLFATAPFNLLKGVIDSILTMLLYKRVSPILHRA